MVSVLQAKTSACNTDTSPTHPHRNSNTHRTKIKTTSVVIQQNSCKLLMMDILMSETCWAHKKWNKIASDIKLVFYSLTYSLVAVLQRIAQENTKLAHVTIAKWETSELRLRFVQSASATCRYCKASLSARRVGLSKGLVRHLRLYYATMSLFRIVNAASVSAATTISSPDEVSEPPSGVFGIVFLL